MYCHFAWRKRVIFSKHRQMVALPRFVKRASIFSVAQQWSFTGFARNWGNHQISRYLNTARSSKSRVSCPLSDLCQLDRLAINKLWLYEELQEALKNQFESRATSSEHKLFMSSLSLTFLQLVSKVKMMIEMEGRKREAEPVARCDRLRTCCLQSLATYNTHSATIWWPHGRNELEEASERLLSCHRQGSHLLSNPILSGSLARQMYASC